MLNLGIFGNPVSHSKSPVMHNMAIKNLGLEGCYGRYLLKEGSKVKEKFLELSLDGANITVPHKEYAFERADEVRGIAKEIGAVNTYCLEGGRVIGYNTDADGFMRSISEFGEIKSVLLFGAGGTAKSIAKALQKSGMDVLVTNRSKDKLEHFKEQGFECCSWEELCIDSFDLLINSTSAGLKDDEFPCPLETLNALSKYSKYAFDVVYGKETPFLKSVKSCGLKTKDGRDMLLYQGVLAFLLFTGNRFDFDTVKTEMQKGLALDAAMLEGDGISALLKPKA